MVSPFFIQTNQTEIFPYPGIQLGCSVFLRISISLWSTPKVRLNRLEFATILTLTLLVNDSMNASEDPKMETEAFGCIRYLCCDVKAQPFNWLLQILGYESCLIFFLEKMILTVWGLIATEKQMEWRLIAELIFIFCKTSQSGTHFGTDWVYLWRSLLYLQLFGFFLFR